MKFCKPLSFFLWLFLLACASCSKKKDEGVPGAITLESIRLADLNGKEIDMTEFENKTVFINFWATWCKPCILEMPTIQQAQDMLKDNDVVFLLASNETVEQIENFRDKRKFRFRYVQAQNLEELNIQALPTTYIFNQKGELVFSEAGFRMWDTPENIQLITKDAEP